MVLKNHISSWSSSILKKHRGLTKCVNCLADLTLNCVKQTLSPLNFSYPFFIHKSKYYELFYEIFTLKYVRRINQSF